MLKRTATVIAAALIGVTGVLIGPNGGVAQAYTGTFTCPTMNVSTPFLNGGVQVNQYNIKCNGDEYYAYGSLQYQSGGTWHGVFGQNNLPSCVYWPGEGLKCNRGSNGYAADGSSHSWGPHTYSVLTDVNGKSLTPYCSHNFKVNFIVSSKTVKQPCSTNCHATGYTVASAVLRSTC